MTSDKENQGKQRSFNSYWNFTALWIHIVSLPVVHWWRDEKLSREQPKDVEDCGHWAPKKKDEVKEKRMKVDREPLIAWREHDNWEESGGRKISSGIDQSGSSISVASNPLLRLPLHPICTRNLDCSVFVFVCVCVEVILHSVCPSLCAYISFVFIYLLMRLSVTCQRRGTWAVNTVDADRVCGPDFMSPWSTLVDIFACS